MCETKTDLAKNANRVPIGVAMKCDHACCAGSGKPPVIVERDLIEAFKFCISELQQGLNRTLEKVRGQEATVFLQEIDADLAEAVVSVSGFGVCIENLLTTKGGE